MRLIFVLTLVLLYCQQASSAILYEESFDAQADWEPIQPTSANTALAYYNGEASIPDNFHNYRVDNTVYGANNSHQTLNISNENYRGTSGKGLTVWHESGETSCGGGAHYCSDGILSLYLPSGYSEMWVQFYMKWDTSYSMALTNSVDPQVKTFRITHWDESAGISPFTFFDAGAQRPINNAQIAAWNGGNANYSHFTAFRYENTYYPDNATPPHVRNRSDYYSDGGQYDGTGPAFNDPGEPGDGSWHKYVYHVKMNSAVGVADGVSETWVDGRLLFSDSTLAWSDSGSVASPRKNWNMVMFGGNSFNEFDPVFTNYSEQYYAFDDICVATTEADLAGCFGGKTYHTNGSMPLLN